MKAFLTVFLVVLILSLFPNCIHSQEAPFSKKDGLYSQASFAEKIYLQLVSKVYTSDNTIWYKCIITNAIDHAPTALSGVLYVELIDPNEKIADRKILRIEDGIACGHFELNEGYSEGLYLIRAYTEWNKNFDKDFYFKEYIRVFALSPEEAPEPISNISLLEKQNSVRQLSAYIDPLVIDSLHEKEIILSITSDYLSDTISLKRNRDKKYELDYSIYDESKFVTLQFQTKNLFTFTKTIALNEDGLDLQFFPESGEFIHGQNSKVGFKAIDHTGKGKRIEGEIHDDQGKLLTQFESNSLGMGVFNLTNLDTSRRYFARLSSRPDDSKYVRFPLPEVSAQGNVLSVNKIKNELRITASSSYLRRDSICIRVSCRGKLYYDLGGSLNKGVLVLSIPTTMLPEGIIAFTMLDNQSQALAERLFFNLRPENRISIDLFTDKDVYKQRELTKLYIEASDITGEGVSSNISVLVLNNKQMGQIQSTRQNILSYLLLSSDLKGEIENPGFYFNNEDVRLEDLDALLLTQGWRRYLYTKPINRFAHKPEASLTVSGFVEAANVKKRKKEVELTMMTFGQSRSVQSQSTDSLGRFDFNIDDEYGEDINILIQSARKSGKKKNYSIQVDRKNVPPIEFIHKKSIEVVDTTEYELVEENIERKRVEEAYQLSSGAILLEEVIVEGYSITPDRAKVSANYGMPDEIISGKALQENELEWSSNLFTVLKHKYPEKIAVGRVRYSGGSFLQAYVPNREPSLFVIDGIPAHSYEYPMLADIPISEVKSIEIIEHAYNFADLYRKTYHSKSPLDAPKTGNVIALYTREGKGMAGINASIGLAQMDIPVFSNHREFYAPKHNNLKPDDWYKPDLRALVHWEPKLYIDSLGIGETSFYNADYTGEMLVVVEAISKSGEIGYQEIIYEVEEK